MFRGIFLVGDTRFADDPDDYSSQFFWTDATDKQLRPTQEIKNSVAERLCFHSKTLGRVAELGAYPTRPITQGSPMKLGLLPISTSVTTISA